MARQRVVMIGLVGLTVALLATLLIGYDGNHQRSWIYSPRKYTAEEELGVLQKYGVPAEAAIEIVAPDRTRLRAYWMPIGDRSERIPTVLYLHGNTGKIEWGISAGVKWQRHMEVNFLVLSYRGFGRSEGTPNMEGVKMDSQAALDWLCEKKDVDKSKIVLYGHSLGGAVALHLAAENADRVSAVIAENTFLRIARIIVGNSLLSRVIEPLIGEPWDNEHHVRRLLEHSSTGSRTPHVLLLSGLRDRMVPHWHTEVLWEALQSVPGSRNFVSLLHRFVDGGHSCHAQPDYYQRIKQFLEHIHPQ